MPEEKPKVEEKPEAEERTPIDPLGDEILAELPPRVESRVVAEVGALRMEIQAFRLDTHGRLAALEGGFAQMDKRQTDIVSRLEASERNLSQIQWSMVSGFLITIVAILLTKLL